MENNNLSHAGIKGMKWGVRRFQNKDGSLTPEGKRRRRVDNTHEDYKKAHSKKKVREMSNQELRDRNQRLQMEKQYKDLTKKTNAGKKAYNAFIAGAGMITASVAAYGVYKKYAGPVAKKALDKIGDWVVKDLKI